MQHHITAADTISSPAIEHTGGNELPAAVNTPANDPDTPTSQQRRTEPGGASDATSRPASSQPAATTDPKTILDEKLHVIVDHLAQRLQHALVHVWALFCLAALRIRRQLPVLAEAFAQQVSRIFSAALPQAKRQQLQATLAEVPDGFWAKLHWLWELPMVRSIRITLSVANWGVRLPAILALLFTQGSIIASQVGPGGRVPCVC